MNPNRFVYTGGRTATCTQTIPKVECAVVFLNNTWVFRSNQSIDVANIK